MPRMRRSISNVGWILAAFVLLVAAWFPWRGAVQNGFVYDDTIAIEKNERVHGFSHTREIFTTEYWNRPELPSKLYRPLTLLSFACEWSLLGPTPGHFHATNIVLHGLVTLLVSGIVFLLLRPHAPDGDPRPAFVTAGLTGLLFAAHPLHAEAILPLVGRAELRVGIFGLAAIAALAMGGRWQGLAPGFLLWALLSKESAVLLVPFTALLVGIGGVARGPALGGRRRTTLVRTLGLLAPALLVTGVLRALVLRGIPDPKVDFADNPLATAEGAARVGTAFTVFWKYFLLHLWPARLSPDYSHAAIPVRGFAEPSAWMGVVLALALAALVAGFARRNRLVAFGAGWYLIGTLAISNVFFVIGTCLGERLTYLPGVGLFFVFAGIVHEALRSRTGTLRLPVAVGASCLVLLLFVFCVPAAALRTHAWSSNRALFEQASRDQPASFRVWTGLGEALMNEGRLDDAKAALERSLAIHDGFGATHSCLLSIYYDQGDKARAKEHALRLREIVPLDAKPYYVLAEDFLANGQLDRARAEVADGLRFDPDYLPLQLVAARVYRASKEPERALLHYERVLRARPDLLSARAEAGPLYVQLARWSEAVEAWRPVFGAQADWSSGNYLAWSLLNLARTSEGDVSALLAEAEVAVEAALRSAPPEMLRYPLDTKAALDLERKRAAGR